MAFVKPMFIPLFDDLDQVWSVWKEERHGYQRRVGCNPVSLWF